MKPGEIVDNPTILEKLSTKKGDLVVIVKKSGLLIVTILIITLLTATVCFGVLATKPIGNASANNLKIVLDAGHGGVDGGVSGVLTGVKESDLNLSVVKKLEKFLIGAGFSVVLTRSTDAGLYGVSSVSLKKKDMQKRRDIIKKAKPNLVVSVHMNKYSLQSRRGAQVFYKKTDEKGKLLAQCVQDSFNQMKEAVRECNILTGDYYILNCSEYPSIIAECGFLSNPEDEALLITEEYQESIAYSIFKGIITYMTKI